jgi:hypothetical protein
MKTDKESRPVQVFAGSAVQAQLLKSLLENAEIEAYLKDEFTGIITPFHSAGGTGAVKIFVSGEDRERARLVVEEFERNLNND